MHQHRHCFSHPRPSKGDCIIRHYSFDNQKVAEWNTRQAEEPYDAIAADDDNLHENLAAHPIERLKA